MNQGRPAEGKEVPVITQLNFATGTKFYFWNSKVFSDVPLSEFPLVNNGQPSSTNWINVSFVFHPNRYFRKVVYWAGNNKNFTFMVRLVVNKKLYAPICMKKQRPPQHLINRYV